MQIVHSKAEVWAASYNGPLYHALLCDPPYHLVDTVKRFGASNAAPAQYGTDGAFQRASKGFMGRDWDGLDENGQGVAFRPETWHALMRCLHPGAFGMAFASTRGVHRMACAIEDAGFILHPTTYLWSFGQGFPKATRIKYATCQCEAEPKYHMSGVPKADLPKTGENSGTISRDVFNGMQKQDMQKYRQSSDKGTQGRTKRGMEGRGYISAQTRKLRIGKVRSVSTVPYFNGAKRWIHNGTPISNSNHGGEITNPNRGGASHRSQPIEQSSNQFGVVARQSQSQTNGTWNYCSRCGLPDINPFQGHRYGLQALKPSTEPIVVFQKPYAGRPVECITRTGAGALNIDAGRIGNENTIKLTGTRRQVFSGLSRAVPAGSENGRWPANLILQHTPDCDATCVPWCPVVRLGAQSGESASKRSQRGAVEIFDDVYEGDSWRGVSTERGHDDTGTAARFFYNADWMLDRLEDADPVIYVAKASTREREAGLEAFETTTVGDGRETPIDNAYQRGETQRRNIHPTIKPLSLTRYLATLLLPPAEYADRRLLVPFSGAGSEMIGAMLAGWEHVTGVEMTADYIPIAEARIAFWSGYTPSVERKIVAPKPAQVNPFQASLFDEAA